MTDNIIVDVNLHTKEDVLTYLGQKVVELGWGTISEHITEAFWEREQQGSTGLLDGFAIPHAKSDAVISSGIIILKNNHELLWESMDNMPVQVIIAMVVPENTQDSQHLSMLSSVAKLLMNPIVREQIKTSVTCLDIKNLIVKHIPDSDGEYFK